MICQLIKIVLDIPVLLTVNLQVPAAGETLSNSHSRHKQHCELASVGVTSDNANARQIFGVTLFTLYIHAA